MSKLAHTALGDLDHEMAGTRTMLARLPEAHLDFTPHAKSWPLYRLAAHLTDMPMWGAITINTSELDFASAPPNPPVGRTAAALLQQFDERLADFRKTLESTTDEALMESWTLRSGDHVIFSLPRIAVLRSMVMNHMVHHRAQLTIYYRLVGVSVPGHYGPSADET